MLERGHYVRTSHGKIAIIDRISGSVATIRSLDWRCNPKGGSRTVALTSLSRCAARGMATDKRTGQTFVLDAVDYHEIVRLYGRPGYHLHGYIGPGELITDDRGILVTCAHCGGKNTSDQPCRACGDSGEQYVTFRSIPCEQVLQCGK